MRRRDKIKNIQKANILAEQRYLQSKGFITETAHPDTNKVSEIIAKIEKIKDEKPFINCELFCNKIIGDTSFKESFNKLPNNFYQGKNIANNQQAINDLNNKLKVGDIVGFGPIDNPRHYAIYMGDGSMYEVDQWGSQPTKKLLIDNINEYESISAVYREKSNNDIKELFKEADDNITDCDCCKYFDMGTDRFGGFEHPIYYALNKSEIHELKLISPDDYIKAIAKGFNLSPENAIKHVNWDNVEKYANDMKKGDKFPLGYYTFNNSGQEGRHRALALKKLNCNNMPVITIKNLSSEEKDQFANKYKNMSTEELNQEFINLGYEGVSGLDIRELNNYIRYREL